MSTLVTFHLVPVASSNAARISFCVMTAVQVLTIRLAVSAGCLRMFARAVPTEARVVQVTGEVPES